MKIGPLDNKPTVAPASADRKSSSSTAAGGSPEASAKVEISSAGSLLASASADPTFDKTKVDRIAQAIRDGKYEVNAEAIADKLLANARELLGGPSSH